MTTDVHSTECCQSVHGCDSGPWTCRCVVLRCACFSYGYPDATYLQRVTDELAAKGVLLPETDNVAIGNSRYATKTTNTT